MLIDCDACAVRGAGCADCVITTLVGAPPVGVELTEMPAGVELDAVERAAVRALAAAGLDPQFLGITAAADPDQDGRQLGPRADWLGARQTEAERSRRAG